MYTCLSFKMSYAATSLNTNWNVDVSEMSGKHTGILFLLLHSCWPNFWRTMFIRPIHVNKPHCISGARVSLYSIPANHLRLCPGTPVSLCSESGARSGGH
jgi:hypothetical protein